MSGHVYLDYNASAPPRPEVIDAIAAVLRESANASSIHRPGRAARGRGARPSMNVNPSGAIVP